MHCKLWIKIMAVIFLVAALIGMSGMIFLPKLIEPVLVQTVSKTLDLESFECTVEKIGFSHILFRNIRTKTSLAIDTISVHYSLADLIKRQTISFISISGMTLNLMVDPSGGMMIQDLKPDRTSKPRGKKQIRVPPLLPGHLEIKNSTVYIHSEHSRTAIPFSMSGTVAFQEDTLEVQAKLHPFGEEMILSGRMNTTSGIFTATLDATGFNLKKLTDIIHMASPDVVLSGTADIHIVNRNIQETTLTVSRIHVDHPVNVDMREIKADILIESGRLSISGGFLIQLFDDEIIGMEYILARHPDEPDDVRIDMKTRPTSSVKALFNGYHIEAVQPALSVSLKGNALKGKASVNLSSENIQVTSDAFAASAVRLNQAVHADYDFSQQGNGLDMVPHIDLGDFKIMFPVMEMGGKTARVSGNIKIDKTFVPDIRLETWMEGGWGRSDTYDMVFSGMDAYFPISFPVVSTENQGRITVQECRMADLYSCRVDGFLKQTGKTDVQAWGAVSFPEITGFKTDFDMAAHLMTESGVRLVLNAGSAPFAFTPEKLEKFMPKAMKGMDFSLNVSSKAEVVVSENKIKSGLILDILDSEFFWPEHKISAQGINTTLTLDDLLLFRSQPAQKLTLKTLSANTIRISDMVVRYNMEAMNSVLVENIRFKWCNGHISTEAFRVPSRNQTYEVTLYCDRLDMSQLLEQIGAFKAQGEGTLNGRIPVLISKGSIRFDNGFLFSTPGSGGRIMVENTDRLIAGMPEGTAQFAQLDLAGEALKNYEYEWAKLVMNTEGETLVLNLQFDGQPANPVLPFEFKKELGTFIRVDSSSPGSHFQGIKLDVNLKLPFDQVMEFGNQINALIQ